MVGLISVPGECRAIVQTMQLSLILKGSDLDIKVTSDLDLKVTSDLRVKVTGDLYEIVLIIFIAISAITNFWVGTFTHPPSKVLHQILSTKKFNDSAVILTMFVSSLWILSCSTSNPASSFAPCLFSLAFCHCEKILKDHFVTYHVDFGVDFSNSAFFFFIGSF